MKAGALLILVISIAVGLGIGFIAQNTLSSNGSITGSGTSSGGGQSGDIASAITSGKSVLCTTTQTVDASSGMGTSGTMMSGTVKIKYPKLRFEGTLLGMQYTMISDGTYIYAQTPTQGETWYRSLASQTSGVNLPTTEELKQEIQSPPKGTTISCQITSDISNSEFQVPAGAQVQDAPASS